MLFAATASVPTTSLRAACLEPPGDVDGSHDTDIVDVQCSILVTLWALSGSFGLTPQCLEGDLSNVDANCDGEVTTTDILLIVFNALGKALEQSLDSNGDQCVDACQSLGPALGEPCDSPVFKAVCTDTGDVLACQEGVYVPHEQTTFLPCDCVEDEQGEYVPMCAVPGFVGIDRAGRSRQPVSSLRDF